jgi:hypothetical protein
MERTILDRTLAVLTNPGATEERAAVERELQRRGLALSQVAEAVRAVVQANVELSSDDAADDGRGTRR